MPLSPSLSHTLASSCSVLELFVIPVGGGIPTGVLLARGQGLAWPLALIMIAFGVDLMTGRASALAAGHGFVAGWAIAIAGDLLSFGVIAISTLRLNAYIQDPNTTRPQLDDADHPRRDVPAAGPGSRRSCAAGGLNDNLPGSSDHRPLVP